MNVRGPDAQRVWSGGPVAFGHTLLRTTEEAEHEHQPLQALTDMAETVLRTVVDR